MWWWTRLEISWCGAITAHFLPKWIYEKANSLLQVVLHDISMFFYFNQVNWLFICWKQRGTALFTNCLMDPHVIRWALLHLRFCSDFDTIGSARCTTILGQLLQIHYNRIRWTNSKEMLLQCIILSYCRVRNKVFTLEEKHKPFATRNFNIWLLDESNW